MTDRIQKAARAICERVAKVTPQGLPWDFALPRIATFEKPLSDALTAWATDPSRENRDALRRTAEDWAGAWERAGSEWVRAGRPPADPGEAEYLKAEREGIREEAA
jgi:hypothetical protein